MTVSIGFVGTFPPTQCGIATFTAALHDAMSSAGDCTSVVIRLVETPMPRFDGKVRAHLIQRDPASLAKAARELSECDVAIVQHEYGIYGGPDGDEVLALLDSIDVPVIVVVHTVLGAPTIHQRTVLEQVVAKADAVVTMTESARSRLVAGYRVDPTKIAIIAHGAAQSSARTLDARPTSKNPTVLTWGLLGPGKGIEWGIAAMAQIADVLPQPRYVIAGQTHPRVLEREGERYRDGLTAQVSDLGLEEVVQFDARYHDLASLAALVSTADVVLLPYDSTDQVTSGVLIEAVAAGKPVVATAFPHARELLADGAGLVVAHGDPYAIADALRSILTRRDLATSLSAAATARSAELLWPAVAEKYLALTTRLISGLAA